MTEQYDVIVIGSGAGGGTCAWSLANQGLTVCLLEAGPGYNFQQDYRLHQSDWEQQLFPEKKSSQNQQSFAELQSLQPEWSDLRSRNHIQGELNDTERRAVFAYHHIRGLGGSTLHVHRRSPSA